MSCGRWVTKNRDGGARRAPKFVQGNSSDTFCSKVRTFSLFDKNEKWKQSRFSTANNQNQRTFSWYPTKTRRSHTLLASKRKKINEIHQHQCVGAHSTTGARHVCGSYLEFSLTTSRFSQFLDRFGSASANKSEIYLPGHMLNKNVNIRTGTGGDAVFPTSCSLHTCEGLWRFRFLHGKSSLSLLKTFGSYLWIVSMPSWLL